MEEYAEQPDATGWAEGGLANPLGDLLSQLMDGWPEGDPVSAAESESALGTESAQGSRELDLAEVGRVPALLGEEPFALLEPENPDRGEADASEEGLLASLLFTPFEAVEPAHTPVTDDHSVSAQPPLPRQPLSLPAVEQMPDPELSFVPPDDSESADSPSLELLASALASLTETISPDPETVESLTAPPECDEAAVLDELLHGLGPQIPEFASSEQQADGSFSIHEPDQTQEKFVLFAIGNERYAVAIQNVVETDRLPQSTRLPHTPDFVRGVVNLRGEIVALLDLRQLWGLTPLEGTRTGRLLVVRAGSECLAGLVVDEVSGIASIAPESLMVPSHSPGERIAPSLRGIYSHQDRPLHVLDLERLFLMPEIQHLAAG